MLEMESLLALHKTPGINNITTFAARARELDVDHLCDLYHELRRGAPRRHSRDKRYFQGRTGVTSSGSYSNRREEHLAVALCNASRGGLTFALPDGRSLDIVDYQTPLKARRDDRGVGKVDLFGVVDRCLPGVIELKVTGTGSSLGDTPLRALLEALAYCAIVEANADDIRSEVLERYGMDLTPPRPALIVAAPEDYWLAYLRHPKAGEWTAALDDLVGGLSSVLELDIHLLGLLDAGFEMGLNGAPARLTGECRVVALSELRGARA